MVEGRKRVVYRRGSVFRRTIGTDEKKKKKEYGTYVLSTRA